MKTVLDKINENYGEADRQLLLKAYHYAEEMHKNQKRASGEPYFTHPCAVAEILIDLGMDTPSVAAAFLHDVIEDTPATAEDIKKNFGDEILTLVEGVNKLDKIRFQTREEEDAENFHKIFSGAVPSPAPRLRAPGMKMAKVWIPRTCGILTLPGPGNNVKKTGTST